MKVITLSAKAQNGKDTTATILKQQLEEKGYKVLITHYADLLKYMCKTFFDWNGKKDEQGRSILQYVGTDVIRKQSPNFWVEFIASVLKLFPNEWDYVLIPDCRFPNEIEMMRDYGFNVTSIKIIRPNFNNGLTEEQNNHPSETALNDYKFDITITNTTLDNLNFLVSKFINELL